MGGGLEVRAMNSLTDVRPIDINDTQSNQVEVKYEFDASIAPKITIQIQERFKINDDIAFYYLGLSYSTTKLTTNNYQSDMLLNQEINGNKLIVIFGLSWVVNQH